MIGHSKEFRYDFSCRDTSGAVFIVEMQNYREKAWFKRCVSYASRAYNRQNRKGQDYDVQPVYLIGLMGVKIDHPDHECWKDRYVSEYTFREKESHDLLEETIVITFVELARFCKTEDECHTKLDRMLFLLKNSGRLSTPPNWSSQEDFTDFLDACDIDAFDDDKRYNYNKDMYDEKRRNGEIAAAKEEGMAQGEEIGVAKGVTLVAKKMLVAGIPHEQIAQLTGLDLDTVKQLAIAEHVG